MRCSPSMEAKSNLESRLPGRHVTEGPARAPHRHDGMRSALPFREVIADSVPRKALENAAAVVAASGISTNAAPHQSAVAHECSAVAHECGVAFNLFDVVEVFKRTPYIADLKPAGR